MRNVRNKEENKVINSNLTFSTKSKELYIILIIVVLIIVIVGIGIIFGGKYLSNTDESSNNGLGTSSGPKYNFSSLEEMTLEVEGKKEDLPSTLQQLLDFGFDYSNGGGNENFEKIPVSNPEWFRLKLSYNKNVGNSYGPLIVKIDYSIDKEVFSLNTLITSYEFDWRYLVDDGKPQKYDYISLGGIKYGMSITAIKEYYKDFVTDIDNGIRIEKNNIKVNGTDVKRIYLDIYGDENELFAFVKAMSLDLEF